MIEKEKLYIIGNKIFFSGYTYHVKSYLKKIKNFSSYLYAFIQLPHRLPLSIQLPQMGQLEKFFIEFYNDYDK